MTYQKPELFLVGAAQGLVLGVGEGQFSDHSASGGNCDAEASRDIFENCPPD